MTERRINLPDPACASICKNSMNDVCIEKCAPQGEMEHLEVRGELTIESMPRYQPREDLKWKARFRLQDAYTEKAVDFIQGHHQQEVPHGNPVLRRRRRSPNSERCPENAQARQDRGEQTFQLRRDRRRLQGWNGKKTLASVQMGSPEVSGEGEASSD